MKTDALLKSDVTSELAWDTSVGERAGIGIAVRDGVVTVSGQVDNDMQQQAIERAVRRVSGVRGIAMDLEVKLAAGARPSDTDIAQAALNAMRWHSMVPEERVQIEVVVQTRGAEHIETILEAMRAEGYDAERVGSTPRPKERSGYLPDQRAGRFSRKARTPSWKSALP